MMKWLTLALAFLVPMVGMGASANKGYLDAGGGGAFHKACAILILASVACSSGSFRQEMVAGRALLRRYRMLTRLSSVWMGMPVATVYLAENLTGAADVNATDADGDPLSYSITGGADQSKFDLNASTGVLVFKSAPDFEVPADDGSNNTYEVTVRVSDGSLADLQTMTIVISNVFEDLDGDGIEDHLDTDDDGDGLSDDRERELGTDPRNPDTDGEGLSDGNETLLGTDPTNPDTDGDGFTDKEEVDAGSDPLKGYSIPGAVVPSGQTLQGVTANYELIKMGVSLADAIAIAASKGGTVLDFSALNDRTTINAFLAPTRLKAPSMAGKHCGRGSRGGLSPMKTIPFTMSRCLKN